AAQSRKSLPSTSSTADPVPRPITSGYPRVYEGDTTALSRSMMALAFGPGSGVLMFGIDTRLKFTCVSSGSLTGRLPEGLHVPPGRRGCDRPPQNPGGGGRHCGTRSAV